MPDVVVIGGSIMGSSLAYHLAVAGHAGAVCVVEPDPTYERAAAPRSAGGVRLMHGLPENIEMARYGRAVYRDFAQLMAVGDEPAHLPFRERGYLYLAAGTEAVAELEASWRVQSGLGVASRILDRGALAARFPFLRVDDVDAGLLGPQDGFIDPYAAVTGLRRKAVSLGVEYVRDRVVGLEASATRVERVVLASGRALAAERVVNAAGAWAPEICAMVGMAIPVVPLSRPTFYFEVADPPGEVPLTKDPSGVSFRTEGGGYASGLTRADAAGGFRWEVGASEHAFFESVMWPALAHRVPAFERLKVRRAWPCHYAMNRLDGNVIVGPWVGGLANFYVAAGCSGAGLQKAPAIGRALAELLVHGRYETIDLGRLSYRRVAEGAPLQEPGFRA